MKYVSPGLARLSRRGALYAASLLALSGTAAVLTPFSYPAFAQSASASASAVEPVDTAMMARIL